MSNPFLLENIEQQPPEAANQNPFSLQAIEADKHQDLRVNMRRAVETSPDDAAEAARLAKRYPAPNDVLLRNLRDVKLQEAVDKADERLRTSPKLAEYMRTGGDFAKQAHDDIEPLAQIEQFFSDTGGSAKAGLFNASKGAAGLFRGASELFAPSLDFLEPVTAIGGNPLRRVAEGFDLMAKNAGATADAATPKTGGILDSGFQSGIQSLTQNALMLPLAFIPGGQPAALSGMVGFTGGQSYQDAREKGLSMSQALPYAVSQAAIEYATEKLPLAQLIGDVKVGAPLYEMIAKQMALEIPGEQIATILQDLNDWAVLHPEKPFSSYLEERPSAAAQTLVATIVGTGGNIAVVKGIEKSLELATRGAEKIQRAESGANALKGVFDSALQSKLRQRNPDAFREAVQNMADTTDGAPSSIYIDAEVFNQSIAAMDPAEVAQAFPTLADQIGPALATGGVIELPIGDVLAVVPGSPLEALILENSRSTPDGLSLAEANQASEQAGEFLKTEADRVLSEAQDQSAWQASAEAVKTTILDQLNTAGRFKSDVNEAYATLVRDFFSVTAERAGMTPEQMYAKYPLRVMGAFDGAGGVLDQSGTNGAMPENKAPGPQGDAQQGATQGNAVTQQSFEQWFKGSKVVDESGNPKPVYHGTTADFTRFDKNARGTNTQARGAERGFFFAGDKADSNLYVEMAQERARNSYEDNTVPKGRILKVFLKAENPLILTPFEEANVSQEVVEELIDNDPDALDYAKDNGYDAVIWPHGNVNNSAYTAVVFESDQIRESDQNEQSTPNSDGVLNQSTKVTGPAPKVEDFTSQDLKDAGYADAPESVKREVQTLLDVAHAMGIDAASIMADSKGADFYETAKQQLESAIRRSDANRGNAAGEKGQGAAEGATQGQIGAGARATFSPSQLAIALGEKADLSSFLHESGHFFLEVMADLASQPDAPAQVAQDMAEALKWFGVPDLATWQGMTLEQQRPYHEKWAESFEQYLLEGSAPSTELQPLFRRFRAWMVNVYKSLAQFMRSRNLALSPEIRQVFDRMLATDDQIRQAEEAAGMLPDFDATNEAIEKLQSRSLKDLKWTVNARSKAIKLLQRQAKDLRKAVEAEVRTEVEDRPVYAARKAFKEIQKLDLEGLTDMYEGDGNKYALLDWKPLQSQKLVGKDGAHPDAAADAFGFDSGDALVKALLEAEPMTDVIQRETDQRMLEEYGDLADPQAIEEAANEAVHNEARARSLATELKAQADAMNPREEVGTDRKGRPVTVNAITAAAKEFALNLTARRKIRELNSAAAQHRSSEQRASKKWLDATAKGDTAEAVKAKRDQLLNNHTAKALQEAEAKTSKQLDYLKKFDRESTRKRLPAEYLDQIDKLLEGVDLRVSTTGRDIDKRASLRAWVESQEAKGLPTAIPESLLDEVALVSYKEMTVEEFGGLIDAIRNIEHLGRLKNKLLTLKDKREFAAIEAQIVQIIEENGGKPIPVELEGRTPVKRWLQGLATGHRKIASLVRQMTGLKDGGPLWDALVRPMNDAGNAESVMIEKATEKLSEIYAPLLKLKGGLGGNKIYIPEINASLSRGGRLSVLLNWGNGPNRQRVMGGDQWTDGQVRAILSNITPVEAKFANDVWEYIDSFWPQVKAKQERVSGVVEAKVEAEPFTLLTKDGTAIEMRGGYYPIKYDSERSARAESLEAQEVAKDMMRGAFTRATTRRGHTKARVDEVNRPVRKNLDVITQHITQVVHDLAWHEWIIDANRIMNSSKIDDAMRTHYGPDVIATMKDGIVGIATADVVPQTRIDDALRLLRSNISRSTMGLSLTTALMQPFGLTQSMVRIGPKHVARGIARFGGDALRFENSLKWIAEKSDFMRLRSKTFNRELREISGRVSGKSEVMQAIDGGLFWLMQKMQLVADVPTWLGAYEKALAENLDDATAVARADQAVLDSQGGGQTKDMAEIQRKHPMLTQFYSYFSVTLNLAAESTATTNFKNPRAVAGWLGDMALLAVVPAIAPALLLQLLKGGGDDDPEAWAKRIAEWQAGYLLGMVVGLRELSGAVSGFDYGGPPSGRIIADIGKAGQQTAQGDIDEPAVMAYIRVLGSAFGIPTVQATRSYRGWVAWSEGDAPATSILFGPPPRE